MNRTNINENVRITSLKFRGQRSYTAFPRRMEFRGSSYNFENGLQYLIRKGGFVTRIFDMTDGQSNYRLKCDEAQNSWTLVSITQCA